MTLARQVEDTKDDSRRRQDAAATVIAQHKDRIAHLEADHKLAIEIAKQKADDAERDLVEVKRTADEVRAELDRRLCETADPSIAERDEKIHDLEASVRSLTTRANTISARYKEGDLVSCIYYVSF